MCSCSSYVNFCYADFTAAYLFKLSQITHDMFLLPLNRIIMKAFHQSPSVVGYTFPSSQKTRISFSSSSYHHCLHRYQLVASKGTFNCNKKYGRLMVTVSSLSGMSYEKFPESAWGIWKDSSSESLKNMKVFPHNLFTPNLNFGLKSFILIYLWYKNLKFWG